LKEEYFDIDKIPKKEIGFIYNVDKSPADNSLIFLMGSKGINWKSDDCGNTFKPLNNGRKIHEFTFHPTEKNWALASILTKCEDFEDPKECEIYKEVYYTTDLGTHWNFLADHVVQFSWAIDDDKDPFISKETVIIVKQKDMNM